MSSSPPHFNLASASGDLQFQNSADAPSSPQPYCPKPKEILLSPIHASSTPSIEIDGIPSPVAGSREGGGHLLPFQEYEDKENAFDLEVELGEDAFHHSNPNHEKQKRFCSTPSPHRSHPADGMRHHLLVQRTFNHHEADGMSPLTTSSPMRKLVAPSASGGLTPRTSKYSNKEDVGHNNFNGATPRFKTPIRGQQLNVPDRDHHAWDRTPLGPRTPAGFMSPASSLYAFSTPGRQFVNPFEMDDERVHFPVMTPGMFQVKQKDGEASTADKEAFWTVDQRALMMPVEMKESDVLRQHFYQTKRNREMEPLLQTAMDRFFSNELIVPSPWSDQKAPRNASRLAQTPTSSKKSAVAKSVSCQTMMSVPPDVDLWAVVGDKYRLPDDQLVHESPVDSSLAGSFIRRKLLHQLNENDSVVVGASPILPSRTLSLIENVTASTSPSPTKHVTPELEKQTPNKKSSGHFSSSPIRTTGDKGHHPAMSESDLLASPELSPIAGRGSNKPLRSSDMFTPRQEFERSREIMQLDFSSILDEPDEFDNANLSEKTGTLIQTKESDSNSLQQGHSGVIGSNSLQDTNPADRRPRVDADIHGGVGVFGDAEEVTGTSSLSSSYPNNDNNIKVINNSLKKSLLSSFLSAESSAQDILPTNMPNLLTSQDTGYQTASLQSMTTQESVSNPQSQLHDIHSSSALSLSSSTNHSLVMSAAAATNSTNTNNAQSKMVPSSSSSTLSIDFSNLNPSNGNNNDYTNVNANCNKDHSFNNKYTGIVPHSDNSNLKSDMFVAEEGNSLDSYLCSGARLSYLFNDNDNNNDLDFYSSSFTKGHNNCRVRKIRTLADVRRKREKSSASRDLTSSFNEEAKSSSSVIVRLSRSLSNPSINMDSAMSCTAMDALGLTTADVMDEDRTRRKSTLNYQSVRPNPSADGQCFDFVKDEVRAKTDQSLFSTNTLGNSSLRGSTSSLEKRPFENIGARALDDFELDEVQVDDCDGVQNSNKFMKLLEAEQEKGFRSHDAMFSNTNTDDLRPKFSLDLEDKNTLDKARELLGKAEALRMQHDREEGKGQLEMDTFYQYISDHNSDVANFPDIRQPEQERNKGIANVDLNGRTSYHHQSNQREKMSIKKDEAGLAVQPVRVSLSDYDDDDAMFDDVEEKINSVEGVKLGSEIAAEILKRAGEDLAQFTTLIDGSSTSPKLAPSPPLPSSHP